MRFLLSLSLLCLAALLSGAASAVAIEERSACLTEICLDPYTSASVTRQAISAVPIYRRDLRNAQSFARGLPLKPPTRRTSPAVAARDPAPSLSPPVTYNVVVEVFSGATSLGYVATDPNFWTPQLNSDVLNALQLSFTLPQGETSGSQLDLKQDGGSGSLFGLVVGRDSTSSNIAAGSFNYLYLDPVTPPGSAPGSVPVSIPSYFSTSSGLDKQAETSVWSVDIVTGAVTAQWINTDGTTPDTRFFVQNNHLYSGGDPDAYHSKNPAPVTTVTLVVIPL